MKTSIPLSAGLLTVAAILFIVSIRTMPIAPDPPPPVVHCEPESLLCQQQSLNWQAYQQRLASYRASLWWPDTIGEVGESLAAVTVLALAAPMMRRATKPNPAVTLPRALRDASLLSALCCAAAWACYSVVDFYIPLDPGDNLHISRQIILPASHFGLGFGGTAFLLFGGAFASFVAWRLDLGLTAAVYRSLKLFALPAVVVLTAALLVLDTSEMDLYVVQFLSQAAVLGVPLFSNWFVMIVSATALLLAFSQAHRDDAGGRLPSFSKTERGAPPA
jgi:hypothetical protein